MSPSIATTVSRVMGNDPKQVPRWSMPMLIDPKRCPTLGALGRHTWHDWPDQRLEVETEGELLSPDSPAIAIAPYFRIDQDGGGYLLQPLRAHIRGTYADRIAAVTRGPKPPAAQRPVDMLDVVSLLTGHTQRGKFAIRGAPAIIARYKSKGIEFVPIGDGSDVMVVAAGGQLLNDHRDAVQLLSPLLVPFILNGAVHCEVSKHREPVDAVTIAFAIPTPIPWDGVCS